MYSYEPGVAAERWDRAVLLRGGDTENVSRCCTMALAGNSVFSSTIRAFRFDSIPSIFLRRVQSVIGLADEVFGGSSVIGETGQTSANGDLNSGARDARDFDVRDTSPNSIP